MIKVSIIPSPVSRGVVSAKKDPITLAPPSTITERMFRSWSILSVAGIDRRPEKETGSGGERMRNHVTHH